MFATPPFRVGAHDVVCTKYSALGRAQNKARNDRVPGLFLMFVSSWFMTVSSCLGDVTHMSINSGTAKV